MFRKELEDLSLSKKISKVNYQLHVVDKVPSQHAVLFFVIFSFKRIIIKLLSVGTIIDSYEKRILHRNRTTTWTQKVHLYADDTQLYFHTDPSAVDSKVQKLVTRVGDNGQWMCTNRLKLTTTKLSLFGLVHRTSCPFLWAYNVL